MNKLQEPCFLVDTLVKRTEINFIACATEDNGFIKSSKISDLNSTNEMKLLNQKLSSLNLRQS